MPYRIPAPPPKEPEPMIPFCERHPRLYGVAKQASTFAMGMAGLAAIVGLLWVLGWGMRAVGLISPTDTAPNILCGLLGVMVILIVGMVGAGTYLLGKGIMCKLTGEKFPL